MVKLSVVVLSLIAATASGAPLEKRIAQTISASTAKWEQACIQAGGGQQCNPISITAFSTLLAAAGPCEQQDAADQMVDLAKQLNNDAQMITLAQIFAQQPRNTPTSQSVPYCQKAPKNQELNGLFQCQFQGANPTVFVGGVQVGGQGTIPFGRNAPVSPPGSCPASPSAAVPDGQQLVDVTQTPRADGSAVTSGNSSGASSGASLGASGSSASATKANTVTPVTTAGATAPATTSSTTTTSSTSSSNGSAGFKLQNGKDAQALNAKFATLDANTACTSGENACVGTAFGQCVGGKFQTTQCAGGLNCFALPLVNSAGTSITCTTEADATSRIAATGATGGIKSNGGSSSTSVTSTGSSTSNDSTGSSASTSTDGSTGPASSSTSNAVTNDGNGNLRLQNGQDAQKLNARFATLSANSVCTSGENACVGSAFAQCAGGKFVTTPCAGGLTCAALPLVNSRGTSITCTTQADALARIQATGATGGLTG
ncbi:hypothetical protein AMATHDRAFT_74604 [Amanita thiersii Skay4041]|uniref:Carbohydrate-binding module family 19 domain-containing protein n=1 Tax=Amanita thiersii Skay4041 TaxID=703135 RepID=A0A2A9NMY8_9AGAR|nr:hypothetical protein AMATHDRAFT_74604 [Amanita thiersii Skay4041]